jgi:predicted RNase H-like HicB family nuclease
MNDLAYTAVYEEVENGWTQARIIEIPGVITAAASRDQARELLRDALWEYLASFMEDRLEKVESEDRERLRIELTPTRER